VEKCADCQVPLSIQNSMPNGRCYRCHGAYLRSASKLPEIENKTEHELCTYASKSLNTQAFIDAIMLTTETSPKLNITKRIEIVTAECAFGMNIFKDLFAGVRDIVGGRSEAVQKTMRDSRRTTLYELKKEAHAVGANAVIGVDLDYIELSSAGSMVLLVASGTAVIVEGIEDCSK
jgi:uncharacterized protein YbjQ (UPF0145 family)